MCRLNGLGHVYYQEAIIPSIIEKKYRFLV